MEKRKREEERRRERRDRKRDSVPSTDALLPIEDVMDGVIVTRDSRFLAVSEFSPVSFMSLSLAEKRQAADRFARVLKAFPASVQVKSVSFRADTSKLEEVMTSADIPSGDGAEKLRSEYLSMLRGAGSAGMVTRRLFVIYEAGGIEVSFDETRQRLDRMRHTLESMMLSAGISPVRGVETDEGLLRFLFSLLNRDREPSRFDERVRKTAREYGTGTRGALCVSAARLVAPDRISFVSPSVMDISGRRYVFGYVPGTSIPPSVTAGWLTGLMCRGEGVDVDMFFEKLPSARAASRIGRRVRNNRAKARQSSDTTLDYTRTVDVIRSGQQLLEGMARGEDLFNVGIAVTVSSRDTASAHSLFEKAGEMLTRAGCSLSGCGHMTKEAFCSYVPSAKAHRALAGRMKRNMLTSSAAAFFPFGGSEVRDERGIMMGRDISSGSLVALDMFDSSRHPNANGLIVGSSGYGKTFTSLLLAERMVLSGVKVFVIAPAKAREDYSRLCRALGGRFVRLGRGGRDRLNIFRIFPDAGSDEQGSGYSPLAAKAANLRTFFRLSLPDLSDSERDLLDMCILKVYADRGIGMDDLTVPPDEGSFPCMTDLEEAVSLTPGLERVSAKMERAFSGPLSCFSGRDDADLSSRITVFDLESPEPDALRVTMFAVLDLVWGRIREEKGSPKAVFIDEGWKLAGPASDPETAAFVGGIFRTIRGYGGGAYIMSQEMKDFSDDASPHAGAIAANCDLKICLHTDPASLGRTARLLDLSDSQKEMVTRLPRGMALVKCAGGSAFVSFSSTEEERRLIAPAGKEAER